MPERRRRQLAQLIQMVERHQETQRLDAVTMPRVTSRLSARRRACERGLSALPATDDSAIAFV